MTEEEGLRGRLTSVTRSGVAIVDCDMPCWRDALLVVDEGRVGRLRCGVWWSWRTGKRVKRTKERRETRGAHQLPERPVIM
jgi:hypothetical protein